MICFSFTCARGNSISERRIKRGVAVVCLVSHITRDGHVCIIAAGGILVDRDICRDCKRRRGVVLYPDNLVMGCRVTAVIGQRPCPGDDLFSFTCARGYCISERGIKRSVAVVGLVSYITRDGNAGVIAAGGILVDRNICRDCKRRRGVILYPDDLVRGLSVLPQSSVRVHVLVMISSPSHAARDYNISERGIKRGVAVVGLIRHITRDTNAGVIAAGGILVDRDICRDCKRRRGVVLYPDDLVMGCRCYRSHRSGSMSW